MAFVSQVIEEGPRNYVIKVDGTGGDAAALLVDVSALNPPCTRIRLLKAEYSLAPAGTASLLWDATAPVVLWNFFGGAGDCYFFKDTAGIPNNAGAGITGDVLLTTLAANAFSMYLHFVKSDPITEN